ncbi:hypothetical protein [Klebsiella pneumoniae]|uniref:hypothetical protein n=1 Tax=Klebsiella pneumoniae TaxID=573 RepID=UPI001F324B78|nr:hypothetical protein [Klebsiella pneumoniae]MCE7490521.1 hypothetical protein [Klebsiella pneumoniae]MCE7499625.1 hypothetical protein [Klebsiella pneumoniae]MCQ8636440.1 hypothetical protein [Klebsiella pneumoniae]
MINTRSGTRIAVSDTSIQDGVDRFYPPVLDGLEQALFFTAGGDGKNYAPKGTTLPKITGAPLQNTFSKSFPAFTDCIDTGLLDSSEFTVLIVNKPTALPSGMLYRPFFGNWNAAAVEAGKGVGLGSALVQGSNNSISIVLSSVPVADAANPAASTSVREGFDSSGLGYSEGTWRFTALKATSGGGYFKDFTKGVEKSSTFRDGYVKDNRRTTPLRVCGQFGADAATCAPGPETALVLFYRRGLSTDEMATMYAWAKKYCARRGMII